MATIKEITHDTSTTIGDFYDSVVDTDGAFTVSAAAALNVSVNGVDIDFDAGNNVALLVEAISSSTNDFRFRFRVKLDNLINSNSGVDFFTATVEFQAAITLVDIVIAGNGGDSGYNLIGHYRESGKGGGLAQVGTGSDAVSSTGEVCIEMSVLENSPGDVDIEIFINGSSVQVETGIADMETWATLDEVNFKFDPNVNISGNMFYDEFIIDDDSAASGLCTNAELSHLWISTDGGATYTDIGDSATWDTDLVGGVVVVPGTAYQTIFAAVGTDLYKTTNGGTAWSLETAVGYEVDFIDLEKDNTTVFLAKRDAAGANRASLWDSIGASLTNINTGKSTTGGATSGGDVV